MKPRAFKRQVWVVLGAVWAAACLAGAAAFAQESPAPPATPPAKSPKPARVKPENPNRPLSKEIPFPLPINEIARAVKIPQTGLAGELVSQLMAAKIKRIDADHVEMESMNIDLYQADGKSDFHIVVPTSVFNLKTRIIHSDNPVTVRTQDFELTGERMEFDTVERTGKLMGKVQMKIHNLKQVAGQTDETKPK